MSSAHNVQSYSFGMPWEEAHGYVQSLRVKDDVFVSGQVPHDTTGQLVGAGDIVAQTEAVLANLERALSAVGAKRGQVVETTIMVVGLQKHFADVARCHRAFFGDAAPTSTAWGVAELALPDQLIEIGARARLDLRR